MSATAPTQQKAFVAFCQQALNAEHHAILADKSFAALVDMLRKHPPAEATPGGTPSSRRKHRTRPQSSNSSTQDPEAVYQQQPQDQGFLLGPEDAASEPDGPGGVPLSTLLPVRRTAVPAPSLDELERDLEARAQALRTPYAAEIAPPAVKSPPHPFADGKAPYVTTLDQRMALPTKQPVLTTAIEGVPRVPLVAWCDRVCPVCRGAVQRHPSDIAQRTLARADLDDPRWQSAVNHACFVRLCGYDSSSRQLSFRVYPPLRGTGSKEQQRGLWAHATIEAVCTHNADDVECGMEQGGRFLLVRCRSDLASVPFVEVETRLVETETHKVLSAMAHRIVPQRAPVPLNL